MAQVPYQPYSTVDPSGGGGEKVEVNAPGAAFGTNIGQALQGLGSSVEQVGGELFTRAMALQDLRNETDAREAQTAYAQEASLLHADYGAKEGQAAADGLKGYIKAQGDLRQKYRDGLKTEFAQRYYDRDTLPFMQRNIFSAAGHAADENKRGVIGTAEANMNLTSEEWVNPKDQGEYADKERNIQGQIPTVAAAKGWTPDQTADYTFKRLSALRLGQVKAIAHTDPQTALDMLDKPEIQTQLGTTNFQQAQLTAWQQNEGAGTRKLADVIFSKDKTSEQMEQEVREAAPGLAHGDPNFLDAALSRLRQKIGFSSYVETKDNQLAMQKIFNAISGSKDDLDVQKLRAMPGMAEVIDRDLSPKQRATLQPWLTDIYNRRNKQGAEDLYTGLLKMSSDRPEAFLEQGDFSQYKQLNDKQIISLYNKRDQVLKNPEGDPAYSGALKAMTDNFRPQLAKLGILYRPPAGAPISDQEKYMKYTGALGIAVDEFRQEKGRPPNASEIRDVIGPEVIRSRGEPGRFGVYGYGFFGTDKPQFDQDIKAARAWWDANPKYQQQMDLMEHEVSDTDKMRAFVRKQFQDYYSKKLPGGGVGGPNVPQSK